MKNHPLIEYHKERLRKLEAKAGNIRATIRWLEELLELRQGDVLDKDVIDLDFSVRVSNVFEVANIKTVRDIVNMGAKELFTYKNFGLTSLVEVGLKLKEVEVYLPEIEEVYPRVNTRIEELIKRRRNEDKTK
jgi:DNA-directed RNA polymerase alpha subunit